MSSESNDEYLSKVRGEIRAQAELLSQRPLLPRQAPPVRTATPGVEAIDHRKSEYRIGELTDPSHRAFVGLAYRAILKRTPEETEIQTHLALLAAGGTKAEVLGNLRYSPEGRRIGTHIGGLLPRYAVAKAGRVPVLGYLLQMGAAAAALPLLARHQRAANETDAVLASHIAGLAAAHDLASRRFDELTAYAHRLNAAHEMQQSMLREFESALRGRIESLEATANAHAGRLDELAFLRQRVYAINHWSHDLDEAFARIEKIADTRDAEQDRLAANAALAVVAVDSTREPRNQAWADVFASLIPEQGRVLALTCGGDWLALLAGKRLKVSGAESNPVLWESARAQGVTVDLAAPWLVLRRTADASLDGISVLALCVIARAMSAIELLAEAHRTLRAGGVLLIAFAREPAAVAAALVDLHGSLPDAEILAQAARASGFIDVSRIDAADGSAAVLARRSPS